MSIVNKVTVGFVVQAFDTETKKFISQEFVAGDEVTIEDENGIEDPYSWIPEYLPFDMVQPQPNG